MTGPAVKAALEVVDVALAPAAGDELWGRHIDAPRAGAVLGDSQLDIVGWALGRRAPVVGVEVVSGERVLERVELDMPRPDLAAAFPHVPGADRGGYRTRVTVPGMAELELHLRAVLADDARVALGRVRARRRWRHHDVEAGLALVTVVVTVRDDASDVAAAIDSVLAQTYPHFELLVVDDGSTDNSAEIAGRFPGVRVLRLEGEGRAAARNAGLAATTGEYVVFLDARERLLPDALAAGLAELAAHPEAAFTSGRAEMAPARPDAPEYPQQPIVTHDHYLVLLAREYIPTLAAVMHRRAALVAAGSFDAELPVLSERDLYLRVARTFPVHCHSRPVARIQERELTPAEARRREEYARLVLARQRPFVRDDDRRRRAYRLARDASKANSPAVGRVRFGHLRRVTPIDSNFGYGRGTPVDRYYIEAFLDRFRDDVRGRVLEVQEDAYTRRLGGDRVTRSDVISLTSDNPGATIVGDLSREDSLPAGAFDCVIVTQTLHLIYDFQAAVRTLHRALRPRGVALATVPGITPVEWGEAWHWALTVLSAERAFGDVFGRAGVTVESHGNVLAATAFLQGLSAEELERWELDHYDPSYPVTIAIRAVKASAPEAARGAGG